MPASFAVTSPTNLHDNAYTADQTTHRLCTPLARWVFTTRAVRLMLKTYNNLHSSAPDYALIGVYVNGRPFATLPCASDGAQNFSLSLPTGPKRVDLVASLQTAPSGTRLGAFLKSVYFAGGKTSLLAPSQPSNRLLVYGDSIAVGGNAANHTQTAWAALLRAERPVATEGWGWRSLYEDAHNAGLRAALVSQLAAYSPGAVWICIGTNDYGLEKWSAADFGAAYAGLVDDLHSALPLAHIYCQSPILRAAEAANSFGNALEDYRMQIAGIAASRPGWTTYVNGVAILSAGDLDDGVHPTTAGHTAYYSHVSSILSS